MVWFEQKIFESIPGSEDEFWQNIFNRLRADPDVHVLMDEVAFRETGAMTTSRMKQFAEMIKKDNYFWVACKKGCTPFSEEDDLKGYSILFGRCSTTGRAQLTNEFGFYLH